MMNFLKGLGTGVLSFILFLLLTVFSIAFMLHGTVLNPDFITTELNKFDIVSLLNETIKESGQGQSDLSQEMKTSLLNTTTKLEPALKQQVSAVIYLIYDYLRGKSQEPRLANVLSDTIASNDFLVTVINDLDTASLVKEIIAEDDSQKPGGFSKELTTAVVNTLTKLEPQLKKEVGAAISPINDYLWGKRQDLSLADVLSNTVLRPDFVVSVVNEVDIAELTTDNISSRLMEAIPQDAPEVTEYLTRSLDEIITSLEPWLKQQVTIAAGPSLDYLLGKSQTVNVTISTEPALVVVKDTLKDVFLSSPPSEVAGMSRVVQEQYFDDIFAQFYSNLPSAFTFDEKLLGSTRDNVAKLLAQGEEQLSKLRDNITKGLANAEDPLAQVRKYVGYFQTYYYWLIALMIVLAALIFLVNMNIRVTARSLGINLCLFGALDLAGIIIAKALPLMQWVQDAFKNDIPASLDSWLNGLINDVTSIALPLTIGILVVGVALLVVSFIVPKEAKD